MTWPVRSLRIRINVWERKARGRLGAFASVCRNFWRSFSIGGLEGRVAGPSPSPSPSLSFSLSLSFFLSLPLPLCLSLSRSPSPPPKALTYACRVTPQLENARMITYIMHDTGRGGGGVRERAVVPAAVSRRRSRPLRFGLWRQRRRRRACLCRIRNAG